MKHFVATLKSVVLFPLEVLFCIVITLRNFLFDAGLFKVRSFDVPVISVGNISVGGTGKTPHVALLVESFLKKKKRVGIVSRGYGGHYGGYATRVRADVENAAHLYGDEPVYYAKGLAVPVYVAHDRSAAVEKCIAEEHPEVIVSDDSFQHRWLGRAKDIVLLDSTDQNLRLLPLGRLREPLSSLKRADWVVLTKTNFVNQESITKWLDLLKTKGFSPETQNLFLSRYEIDKINLFRGTEEWTEGTSVYLASTIAQPQSFKQLVEPKAVIKKHFVYPDHYYWQQKDIDQIEAQAASEGIQHLLITEKDAVKMDLLVFRYIQVHVVSLALKIDPPMNVASLLMSAEK